ncbi:vWA domain-containing protein [Salinilacihabitans rarus]|uniref:vWA domain-containing protein n=1 Tax=Salinilacihabitans rarus TaxID=2961596 RepID=UPI0020C841D4|nr:VWA domain-containing protein [Salinilacihabitans rarus]
MRSNRRRFLGLCAAGAGASLAGCAAPAGRTTGLARGEKVDDWQFDPDALERGGWNVSLSGGGGPETAADGVAVDAEFSASGHEAVGLAAGGAADVSTFRRNVREGYLPTPESVSYEGLFHEYYFDTGGDGACSSLFCPAYTPAVSPDPLSGEPERYLSVGLDSGLSQSAFERPPLNLVIVLDVSGSMSASFSEYYYDEHGNEVEVDEDDPRPKIDVATDALAALTEHLRPDDRLGVVLFNREAHLAKPLRTVGKTDMDAIRDHIREDVVAAGGTNVSAGLKEAEALMAEYEHEAGEEYENRSILLTDAQINAGETDADELGRGLTENAERGHHTTVVGIGVDFNADLIDRLTSIRGANYYSVYTEADFRRRLDDEFEYLMTPLVYDLSLELDADGWEISQVYGTTAADETTGELMRVHTLFPSPRTDGEAKGGVVLVGVEPTGDPTDETLELEASWETRAGERGSTVETVAFPDGEETYGNDAVRKAILLARYADLLKEWAVHEREGEGDAEDGIEPPEPDGLGRWEQRSDPLTVSERYETRFDRFRAHFDEEASAVGDETLERELELLDAILESA